MSMMRGGFMVVVMMVVYTPVMHKVTKILLVLQLAFVVLNLSSSFEYRLQ